MVCFTEREIIFLLENTDRPGRKFPGWLADLIIENKMYPMMLALACHPDHKIAFRAAWGLEHAYTDYPADFKPYVAGFVRSFSRISDESVKRCYGKIMSHMLRKGDCRPTGREAEMIAETVCRWITQEKAKIANRVNCIEILHVLADRVEWVDSVLEDILVQEMIHPSPGVRSRIRKLGCR